MTRHVKIGEVKIHLSALLAAVEAGEDLMICRGATPVAHVTRSHGRASIPSSLQRSDASERSSGQ